MPMYENLYGVYGLIMLIFASPFIIVQVQGETVIMLIGYINLFRFYHRSFDNDNLFLQWSIHRSMIDLVDRDRRLRIGPILNFNGTRLWNGRLKIKERDHA